MHPPDGRVTGPIRRAYTPVDPGRQDVDVSERVVRFRLLAWSLVGAFAGLFVGLFLSATERGGLGTVLLTTSIGWAGSYFIPMLLVKGAGRAGSSLYAPSGRSTPRKREYSLAESYVARGQMNEAVATFEEAIAEDPSDALPYLRVARIHRDRLGDPVSAERWFKRALAESEMPTAIRLRTRKELVELYEVRLGQPRRAAPLLAQIAAEAPDTPEGAWASDELARIKAEIAADERHR